MGVIYGDGSYNLTENKHGSSGRVYLEVKDQDFALSFKRILEKWSGLKANTNKKDFHKISFHSVDACRIFNEFALERVNICTEGYNINSYKVYLILMVELLVKT